jgi:hypothetical protein
MRRALSWLFMTSPAAAGQLWSDPIAAVLLDLDGVPTSAAVLTATDLKELRA